MKAFDRAVGTYHFMFDHAPPDLPEVPPRARHPNPWMRDGKSLVAKVQAVPDIRESVEKALAALGPLSAAIKRGDKVFVKPNFNSDDPPPASTDPGFLKGVIQILLEAGARVSFGDCSGGIWRPTARVFKNLGLFELAKSLGVEAIAFEDRTNQWVKIKIEGKYLRSVTMPRAAYEADRLVYLPCLKTHGLARYSGALKLAFGFVHPGERRAFHLSYRDEKLAEVNLCWQPDLVIVDGRKAFVTGGPNKGQVVEPGLILASGDPVAIDVEAVKILLGYKARNKLMEDPWKLPQIATAVAYHLGTDYVLAP